MAQALDQEGTVWALARLMEASEAMDEYQESPHNGQSGLSRQWPVVEAILSSVAPEWIAYVDRAADGWHWRMGEAVDHAIGLVRHQVDIARHLGPHGPRLEASGLHRWVWESAAPVWDASKQDAVNAAARAVNSNLRAKLGSNRTEADLTNEAFNDAAPTTDSNRLRFPGARDKTRTSRMNGARGLGQAVFQGIRNPGNHDEQGWSEQEALEYLAAFSVLARWIEECEVESLDHGDEMILAARG